MSEESAQKKQKMSNLESLQYSKEGGVPKLSVLDQLLVPKEKVYIPVPDVEVAWSVIRKMQIRGAPLIAIVACLGLAVDLHTDKTTSELEKAKEKKDEVLGIVQKKMDYLRTSRPTAVNLFNALEELLNAVNKALVDKASNGSDGEKNYSKIVVDAVVEYAEFMLKRDVADNKAIGDHGADALLSDPEKAKQGIRLVTICNTGSLATAGYGTALGVARSLQQRGKLKSIHALETRPYNQGSRLTAFEIVEEGMPEGTLICDSAAAALMKTKGVDACVVGADRCCANGDTANKIGTYMLACVAKAHDVPFYIASPFTTLDTKLKSGDEIEIEERSGEELRDTSNAPKAISCWNPAFDVTPAAMITGIITEKGVIEKSQGGTFDVVGFVKKHSK